jgi:hypothetical protein
MKRFVLVLLVIAFLPVTKVNAQIAVFDAIVEELLANTLVEQAIYYAQTATSIINTAIQTKEMLIEFGEQGLRQLENLNNISKIRSWDDFAEWHNRQLYLEKMTEDT